MVVLNGALEAEIARMQASFLRGLGHQQSDEIVSQQVYP
jgi:hypothetical protein